MAGVIQLHGEDVSRVEPLFAAYDYDRSLIGGVLEDKNPGHVFCEWGANPTAAILFHPVDYAYLAGDAKAIRIETLVVDAPRALRSPTSSCSHLARPRGSLPCGRRSDLTWNGIPMSISRLREHAKAGSAIGRAACPTGSRWWPWTRIWPNVHSRTETCR